jgi:hypothetical protein
MTHVNFLSDVHATRVDIGVFAPRLVAMCNAGAITSSDEKPAKLDDRQRGPGVIGRVANAT